MSSLKKASVNVSNNKLSNKPNKSSIIAKAKAAITKKGPKAVAKKPSSSGNQLSGVIVSRKKPVASRVSDWKVLSRYLGEDVASGLVLEASSKAFGSRLEIHYEADRTTGTVRYAGTLWSGTHPGDRIDPAASSAFASIRFRKQPRVMVVNPLPQKEEELRELIRKQALTQGLYASSETAKAFDARKKRAADDEKYAEVRARSAEKRTKA